MAKAVLVLCCTLYARYCRDSNFFKETKTIGRILKITIMTTIKTASIELTL